MRFINRSIEEVKEIRGDLSTWLVHLTKDNSFVIDGQRTFLSAKESLESILNNDTIYSVKPVGQFNFPSWYQNVQPDDLKAVCFTETPIEEIFLFPNITKKSLKFSSYGLVFDKAQLSQPPHFTAPVMYFSQPSGNRHFVNIMNHLEQTQYQQFKDILFLFDRFGQTTTGGTYDFRWEREWRKKGNLTDVRALVKFGLCPENDIPYFEQQYRGIVFVDPFFNPRQIKKKLRDSGVI